MLAEIVFFAGREKGGKDGEVEYRIKGQAISHFLYLSPKPQRQWLHWSHSQEQQRILPGDNHDAWRGKFIFKATGINFVIFPRGEQEFYKVATKSRNQAIP